MCVRAQNTISAVSASKYTQSCLYFTILLFGYALHRCARPHRRELNRRR
jgi:hypothetical protein